MSDDRCWTALSPESLKILTKEARDVSDLHHEYDNTQIGLGFQVIDQDLEVVLRCRVAVSVSEDFIPADEEYVEGSTFAMVWLHDANHEVLAIAEYRDLYSTNMSYVLRKFFETQPGNCLHSVHTYINAIVKLYRPDVQKFVTVTYS